MRLEGLIRPGAARWRSETAGVAGHDAGALLALKKQLSEMLPGAGDVLEKSVSAPRWLKVVIERFPWQAGRGQL